MKKKDKPSDETPKKEFKLADVSSKAEFRVPDGYFDSLEQAIHEKISEEESAKVRPIFSYWWAAASVLLLCTVCYSLFFQPNKTSTVDELLSEVSDEALISYLAYSELQEGLIFEELEETQREELDLLWQLELRPDELESSIEHYSL